VNDIPHEYEGLTLRDLVILFTGPNALPIPPELREWVECAELVTKLVERQERNHWCQGASRGCAN